MGVRKNEGAGAGSERLNTDAQPWTIDTASARAENYVGKQEGYFPSCWPLVRQEVTYRTLPARGWLHLIPEGKHQEDHRLIGQTGVDEDCHRVNSAFKLLMIGNGVFEP